VGLFVGNLVMHGSSSSSLLSLDIDPVHGLTYNRPLSLSNDDVSFCWGAAYCAATLLNNSMLSAAVEDKSSRHNDAKKIEFLGIMCCVMAVVLI
jgi:hypothetical protein